MYGVHFHSVGAFTIKSLIKYPVLMIVFCQLPLVDLNESNVKLKLTVVDTVGFGDQINKEDRYGVCCIDFLLKFLLRV